VSDWFDPNTWKLPAELVGDWKTILGGLVVIGGFIVSIIRWGLKPLRWLWSRFTGSEVRQKGRSLSFVSKDLQCQWSEARGNNLTGTFVSGHWNVTNSSESDVMILKARLSKYETQLVQVLTRHPNDKRRVFGSDYPIHSHQISEVSVAFTFFPAIGRAPKPIISDVIFTDNFENEYRVRTQFSFIGPKPVYEPSLWSRWLRR
jgi:hypothetical protein